MTDRELLIAIRDQIDAHLAPPPVDCVLGEWRLSEAGPYSTCQPDSFQHRSETWVRDVLVEPAHGGVACGPTLETRIGTQSCVYVPPSGGVIVYTVQIGDHTHYFTDVAEMQVWVPRFVPPSDAPQDPPCSIEWRSYDGSMKRFTFETFSAFKVYVAGFVAEPAPPPDPGALAFPGQAKWREVWPTYNASDVSQAPAGWVSGAEYPERRAFVEGQWWFSPIGDINRSRHVHVGAAIPCGMRGVVEIDVRIRLFHWHEMPGVVMQGLYSVGVDEPGVARMVPAPISEPNPGTVNVPITGHIQDLWIPVRFDTRGAATDGWKSLTFRVDLFRQTDGVHHLVTLRVPVYLDNGGGRQVTNTAGTLMASGWMTEFVTDPVTGKRWELNNFGYIEPSLLMWDPANTAKDWPVRRFIDDPATFWSVRGSTGTNLWPIELLVTKNPDFHLHPNFSDPAQVAAFEGQVLVREKVLTGSKQTTKIDMGTFLVGDRLVLRLSDRKKPNYAWVVNPTTGERYPKRLATGEVVPDEDRFLTADPDSVAATVLVVVLGRAKA